MTTRRSCQHPQQAGGPSFRHPQAFRSPRADARGGSAAGHRPAREIDRHRCHGLYDRTPGFSAFVLDEGTVYHTYATTARGGEFLMGYYGILDRAPKGSGEYDASEFWIRRHDEYDQD